MTDSVTLVFVSLAQNQAVFFKAVGEHLKAQGYAISHICFHEGSIELLKHAGHEVFNPFEAPSTNAASPSFSEFGIDNPSLIIGHEKAAYQIRDTQLLLRKLKRHLVSVHSILTSICLKSQETIVVQELGGFTSVLASYYAAKSLAIDNWFIEPSFFKGRVFFTKNSLRAPEIPPELTAAPGAETHIREYLDSVIEAQAIVIPDKDRRHYRTGLKKLTDPYNFRRLAQKLVDKHLLKRQEEFSHIGGHVRRHLMMVFNHARLRPLYRPLPSNRKIIYYPFHVPADFALTIRSPEYLDQYSVLDYVCRTAPPGYIVIAKEHPALVGSLSPCRIKGLINRHDNFLLIEPSTNNHSILATSDYVITINSKTGIEATLYNCKVIVLGDAFYRSSSLVTSLTRLCDLPGGYDSTPFRSDPDLLSYFSKVWSSSYPGELYNINEDNVFTFSKSLHKLLSNTRPKDLH